jgi:hypothetical protein
MHEGEHHRSILARGLRAIGGKVRGLGAGRDGYAATAFLRGGWRPTRDCRSARISAWEATAKS